MNLLPVGQRDGHDWWHRRLPAGQQRQRICCRFLGRRSMRIRRTQYLVEGQDTENISGGASKANVPFQFIQEVQVKSSGIEAEHGGALGGVVNVVMKKGSNAYHGSFFGTYESDAMDGSPNATLRYDPHSGAFSAPAGSPGFDDDSQTYQPKKDHFRIAQPGFTVGGPIMKDRLWFFLGFAPQYNSRGRDREFRPIASNPSNVGCRCALGTNTSPRTTSSTSALPAWTPF